jgi:diacylglycerol kinase (ATP)
MPSVYSSISIIFNPKSTGASKTKADNLVRLLQKDFPDIPVNAVPTQYAGHASELAYLAAMGSERPLVISSSGDGGYNEVVNGVMRAQDEGADVVTSLLPSGNANDHYHSLRSEAAIEKRITSGESRSIDLLHIKASNDAQTWERYAHSYLGIGITANVGNKLNKISLNPVNEWVVSARIIYSSPPVTVVIGRKKHNYDSLILSNIGRLGKIFTLSSSSQVDDGKFEVLALESTNKAAMLRRVAQALSSPVEKVVGIKQMTRFSFQTTDKQPMQLDGEIVTLAPKTTVEVRSVKRVLRCVL